MKIAIVLTDQSFFRTKSMGIFNVSMGLTRGLMQHPDVTELHILGNNECKEAFTDCPPHVHLHLLDKPVPRRFSRVWWDQFGMSAFVRRIAPDWLILPKGVPPFFPLLGKTKMACYVHDVIWEYYAKLKGKLNPFPWYENIYFRILGTRALKNADLVLTSTQFNVKRFKAHAPNTKAAVVGIGFEPPILRSDTRKGTDILFYASTFPHKLTKLGVKRVKAWLASRKDAKDIKIHVLGSLPEGVKLDSDFWIRHGRLPQAELEQLIQSCKCSIYFSDYEGYGMPPVESLRIGLACVASDIPPIRENIPEQYLFDNSEQSSFNQAINRAFDNSEPINCPEYPTWQEVVQGCICSMRTQEKKQQPVMDNHPFYRY